MLYSRMLQLSISFMLIVPALLDCQVQPRTREHRALHVSHAHDARSAASDDSGYLACHAQCRLR